jgi:hypothetical protein
MASDLTAICELIVQIVWASNACCSDSFIFYLSARTANGIYSTITCDIT